MAVEIRVPPLGESLVEATIARWIKTVGDNVAAGEAVAELDTDKINVEVYSESAGILADVVRAAGETVEVNEVIAIIAESREEAAAVRPAEEAQNGHAQPPATPLAKSVAARDKVDLAKVTGTGRGGKVTREDVEAAARRGAHAGSMPAVLTPEQRAAIVPATPMAPQLGPPPARPAPSAPTEAPSAPNSVPTPIPAPADPSRPEERVKMTRRRQTIAERLTTAQHTAAMLTTFNEVDLSAVIEIRKRRKDSFKEKHGVGLGFMSFFTRATVGALKAFPLLNAEIQGDEILLKRYYDIGVAVSTAEGLVVPVLRAADRKSFAEIEREIADLAVRARENTLSLADLVGGTFTITNGGVFGSLLSTPILNAPQVGILGMHKIEERPVAVTGEVVIRPMMYVALSYDHRIVDGAEAVRFLVKIKELLEDPEALLLEA